MKKGFTLAVVGILAIFPLLFFFKFSTTRAGLHTGYVTAIQQEGLIFHNYKVFFKTDNSSSQEDSYCVRRDKTELAEQLREANKTRKLVTIFYDGERGFGLSLCSQDRIDKVEYE